MRKPCCDVPSGLCQEAAREFLAETGVSQPIEPTLLAWVGGLTPLPVLGQPAPSVDGDVLRYDPRMGHDALRGFVARELARRALIYVGASPSPLGIACVAGCIESGRLRQAVEPRDGELVRVAFARDELSAH